MAKRCEKCNHGTKASDGSDTPNLCREAVDLLREWHIDGGMSCPAMAERLVELGHARISRKAVWKHGQAPEVLETIKEFEREAIGRGYGRRSARLDRLHQIVDDLLAVVESRKVAYADAVGGHTGLVVVHERRYGTGENSYVVKREMVDHGVINQIRKTLEQIQAEVGQTTFKADPALDAAPAEPLSQEARTQLARQILARLVHRPDLLPSDDTNSSSRFEDPPAKQPGRALVMPHGVRR